MFHLPVFSTFSSLCVLIFLQLLQVHLKRKKKFNMIFDKIILLIKKKDWHVFSVHLNFHLPHINCKQPLKVILKIN